MPFYSSVEKLKKHRPCWKTCGIVKIKLELVDWIEKQNLTGDDSDETYRGSLIKS